MTRCCRCWTTVLTLVVLIALSPTVTSNSTELPGGSVSPPAAEPSAPCPTCWTREVKRAHDLALLKANILSKLRLSEPPHIAPRPGADARHVPSIQSMISECEEEQGARALPLAGGTAPEGTGRSSHGRAVGERGGQEGDDSLTIVNVFHIAEPNVAGDIRLLRFSLQDTRPESSGLISVSLFLYLRHAHVFRDQISVSIHRAVLSDHGTPMRGKLVRRRRLYYRDFGSWIQLSVTSLVRDWVRNPATNHGLYVETTVQQGRQADVITLNTSANEPNRPFLELNYTEPDSSPSPSPSRHVARARRTLLPSTNDCDERSTDVRCCRYQLNIDFSVFGWDNWIIAPQRATTYYCSGECPYLFRLGEGTGFLNHLAAAMPCCHPTRVSDMKIVHLTDNGTYLQSSLPGLIVEKCGCS